MKRNKPHIIIFFCIILVLLTGCENKKDIDNKKLRNLEQVNILDIKYLTIYEKISGIQLTKQRVSIKDEEKNQKQDNLSVNEEDYKENQESKSENLVETTKIIYDSNLLSEPKDSDWDACKELCYEIQNIALDIESEMRKNNNIQIADDFEKSLNDLINYVIKEDKKESANSLVKLYEYLLVYIKNNIESKNIYQVKDLYYNCVILLIYLEDENKEKYESKVNELNEQINVIIQSINDSNVEYLIDKINVLINGINKEYNEDEKENTRLKIVMLIKTLSSIDSYIQKVDNYGQL